MCVIVNCVSFEIYKKRVFCKFYVKFYVKLYREIVCVIFYYRDIYFSC